MKTISSPTIVLAMMLAFAGTGVHAEGTGASRSCLTAPEVRELVDKAEVVPAARAIHAARTARPGEVVKVRLCRQDGSLLYLVTILAKDGKIRILEVDGRSGTLIERH